LITTQPLMPSLSTLKEGRGGSTPTSCSFRFSPLEVRHLLGQDESSSTNNHPTDKNKIGTMSLLVKENAGAIRVATSAPRYSIKRPSQIRSVGNSDANRRSHQATPPGLQSGNAKVPSKNFTLAPPPAPGLQRTSAIRTWRRCRPAADPAGSPIAPCADGSPCSSG
jgi:hypothetical protein